MHRKVYVFVAYVIFGLIIDFPYSIFCTLSSLHGKQLQINAVIVKINLRFECTCTTPMSGSITEWNMRHNSVVNHCKCIEDIVVALTEVKTYLQSYARVMHLQTTYHT